MSVKYAGYWMFICNPKKWEIDRSLMSGRSYDSFIITEWQKDHFKPGQLGIVRVGIDRRNKTQLAEYFNIDKGSKEVEWKKRGQIILKN